MTERTSDNRVGDPERRQIRALYSEGLSLRQIGEELGFSKQVIYYHVKRMDLSPPEDAREELLQMLDILLDEDEAPAVGVVAEELSVTTSLARDLLRERGAYQAKVPFHRSVDRDHLIRVYVLEDKSLAELQEVFDVSASTLSKTLKTLGVPLRPRGSAVGDSDLRQEWRKRAIQTLGLC